MRMRKSNMLTGVVASIATVMLIASCGENSSPMSSDVSYGTGAAGTGYVLPNTFDANGDLSIRVEYNPQELGTPMELWMGVGNATAGTLVGHVTFLSNPDRVRIDLTDADGDGGPDMFPYVVTTAHIHFGPDVEDIPHTKRGNPVPGQFEYNVDLDPSQTAIEIPVEFDSVGAIHLAVVKYGGVEGFTYYLPDNQVTLRVVDYPSSGDPSYLKMKITDGGFISDYDSGYGAGIYEAWCIDVDNGIGLNVNYPAYLYSSYEELPDWMVGPGNIEYPENLDKINYLVNTFAAGDVVTILDGNWNPILDGNGNPIQRVLSYGDIQRAIWHYIDDNQYPVAGWDQESVNAILYEVDTNGEGFVPGCEQKIVFLAVPTGTNSSYNVQIIIGQPLISAIEVPCETVEGTAWGDGKYGANFPKAKQWGTWFETEY